MIGGRAYLFRFGKRCVVNKDRRNQCRFCRLRRCYKAGMRKEAVQNERDRIFNRPLYDETSSTFLGLSVRCLLEAERLSGLVRSPVNQYDRNNQRIAQIDDVTNSMREQVLNFVNWAKCIPAFAGLTMKDQIALLRAHAGENLLLGVSCRSLNLNGVLLLGNNCIITKEAYSEAAVDLDIIGIGNRVIEELVKPLEEIQIDSVELACLRAIVFFDPNTKGLRDVHRIKQLRYKMQLKLEDYINDRQYESRGRFGQLMLLLLALQAVAWNMIENLQFAKVFGVAQIDSLLQELLFKSNKSRTPQLLKRPTNLVNNQMLGLDLTNVGNAVGNNQAVNMIIDDGNFNVAASVFANNQAINMNINDCKNNCNLPSSFVTNN